ncbi:hypothetical protein [Mesorhizobium sp. ANAO-SY3R2]|uniref:hypothetical protein n=1 Tax=Mesorhizobium sp. ANAO-SY3R2 TaxID=3166644 RepID=UPI00366B559A
MALAARLERLERQNMGDPFADLTDEELEAAIIAVRQQIEAVVGMPEGEYATALERQIEAQELPEGVDWRTATAFVLAVKKGVLAHV